MPQVKDEFENVTQGQIGVTIIQNGKERGVAVRPGEVVWLSEEEQIATANAPKRDESNPFIGGNQNADGPALVLRTRAGEIRNRRPLGDEQPDPNASNGAEASETNPEEERERARVENEVKAKAAAERQKAKADTEETGAAVKPTGRAPKGSRPKAEEVATPEAPRQASS